MSKLSICAHCIDEQFEAEILRDFQVTILDRSNEPYEVVFEGNKEQLINMYKMHWNNDWTEETELQEVIDSIKG